MSPCPVCNCTKCNGCEDWWVYQIPGSLLAVWQKYDAQQDCWKRGAPFLLPPYFKSKPSTARIFPAKLEVMETTPDKIEPVVINSMDEFKQKFDLPKEGVKFDKEKLRYDLLPFEAIDQIVDVLGYGSRKYADNNWKIVPDARRRYIAAALRHISAYQRGEMIDPESGLQHLAHAACSLVFLLALPEETK
jgi:hypothetical protein